MTDEGAVCNRWVSVKKAYSIDNTSCERRICGGGAFWEFPARLRRFQHWKVEAEEFEAGGEELPTEKVFTFTEFRTSRTTRRYCQKLLLDI